MNILILDDNQDFLEVLAENLESEGHSVCATHSFSGAQKYLQRGQIDLFLLDVVMPNMDGIEIAKLLSQAPRSYTLIAISGGSARMSPALGLSAMRVSGVDAVLQKPFSIPTLMKKVAEISRS